MEIKVIITIDEKVEKLVEQILAALLVRNASEPAEALKEAKRPEIPLEAKSAPKTAKTGELEETLPEPDIPSVSLSDIISGETAKVTAADARVAVNKARDRKVDMAVIKDLITNKYRAANVSSIAEDKLAEFVAEVEAL